MEATELAQPPTPTETVQPSAHGEMMGLPQRCRRLAWLAGILAFALVSLGAWSMVQFSARCAVRKAGQ